MEKFTLYELLSFLLPGFLFTVIIYLYLYNVNIDFVTQLNNIIDNDILMSLLVLVASTILGGVIHCITMFLIHLRIYKKIGLYGNVAEIFKKNNELQFLFPFLNEHYNTYLNKENNNVNDKTIINDMFDYIYYVLDIEKKNETVLSYQSFFFFYRNLCTICLISFIVFLINMVVILPCHCHCNLGNILLCLVVSSILFFIFFLVSLWFRKKMIEKLFRVYYALYNYKKPEQ